MISKSAAEYNTLTCAGETTTGDLIMYRESQEFLSCIKFNCSFNKHFCHLSCMVK